MRTDLLSEITHEWPDSIPSRLIDGDRPLFTAYGCLLLESEADDSFIYRAVNLKTERAEVLSRRANPMTNAGAATMVERIRKSSVAGAGRIEIDRLFGDSMKVEKLRAILDEIFREILPLHGYTVREKQIELANNILTSIARRRVTLAEAEVGTGKTIAYLLAAILIKRSRANDFWNMGYYPDMSYIDMAHMPVVISTSSIALQKAIIRDYIPAISKILMAHGIIRTPLTAAIRKGKEHYICKHNLLAHIPFEQDKEVKHILKRLAKPSAPIDLSETEGLTPHVIRKIRVQGHCSANCPHRSSCRYQQFLEAVKSPVTDIQVCNHNYILADTKRRAEGLPSLIPNYQCLIIDEAHKFLQAARQMYGLELSSFTLPELSLVLSGFESRNARRQKSIRRLAEKLSTHSRLLFQVIGGDTEQDESKDDAERHTVFIGQYASFHMQKISDIADRLISLILKDRAAGQHARTVQELGQIKKTIAALMNHSEHIFWLEKPDRSFESKLCALPKGLQSTLYNDLWIKGLPIILTSGTLSAGAGPTGESDFTHTKQMLGLEPVGVRLTETSKPSPFNHRENTMLYLSENMPFPDNKDGNYISAVTNETERLIRAAHGHTVVLFTSHDALGRVYSNLKKRDLPFPMFRLDKGDVNTIEKFKQSGNGVLFASGAMWEGVDIPGDALSMLIIVKLPFAVPDPISKHEQVRYASREEYIRCVVLPDMLLKLKQGFGRLIRTEYDTGTVAILDSRVSLGGSYRRNILGALPVCRVTSKVSVIRRFYRKVKAPDYFATA